MSNHSIPRSHSVTIWTAVLGAAALAAVLTGSQSAHGAENLITIQSVLQTHQAWTTPPNVIEINGSSTRGSETEPVRITANAKEETAIEYGLFRNKKNLLTPSKGVWDDGTKLRTAAVPPGFAQLDITGLYLLAQAALAKTKPAEAAVFQGAPVQRITVNRGRSEMHLGAYAVEDAFDVYVNESGLLAGLGRSFYPKNSSLHYMLEYAFSDFRDANGVILPHRITAFLKGRQVETITVTGYRFDAVPDPILFTPRSPK